MTMLQKLKRWHLAKCEEAYHWNHRADTIRHAGEEDRARIAEFFDACFERMIKSRDKYDVFDPPNDKRDLVREGEEEALDIPNYNSMIAQQRGENLDARVGRLLAINSVFAGLIWINYQRIKKIEGQGE